MNLTITNTTATVTTTDGALTLTAPTSEGQPRPLRRADHDPGEEWPGVRREMEIRAGAAARAESRVVVAIWRALGLSQGEISDAAAREAAARCEWARGGVGGPGGYAGGSTARPPWAQALGKGRRQADDGPAWDAALERAALILAPRWITPADHVEAVAGCGCEELIFAACYMLRQIEAAPTAAAACTWETALRKVEAAAWASLQDEIGALVSTGEQHLGYMLRTVASELEAARRLEDLLHRWGAWSGWGLALAAPWMEMDHGWTVVNLCNVSARCRGHRRDLAAAFEARGWSVRDIPAQRRACRAVDRALEAGENIIVQRAEVSRG